MASDYDALVEQAAQAAYNESDQEPDFWLSTVDGSPNAASYAIARAVLDAVGPALRAQAWDEGYAVGVRAGLTGVTGFNPFRKRADRIEKEQVLRDAESASGSMLGARLDHPHFKIEKEQS